MRAAVLTALLAAAFALGACFVTRVDNPRLTGTCDGACSHYIECKPGHPEAARAQCRTECPEVFSDRDSLMAYESMTCDNAVEFVDGSAKKTAQHRP